MNQPAALNRRLIVDRLRIDIRAGCTKPADRVGRVGPDYVHKVTTNAEQ